MAFKKGQSGNRAGRPRGTKNRTCEEIRGLLHQFIEANIETLQADFDKLEAKDRLVFIDRLLKHVIPAPQDELMRLSDEDLDRLIERLKSNHLRII